MTNIMPRFDKDSLDLEIREVVIRLNESGFFTYGSCAGHRDCPPGHGDRGFISFVLGYSHDAIREALNWYGLKNITIEDYHAPDGDNCIFARFDPIGSPLSSWWLSQYQFCKDNLASFKKVD